MDLFLSVFFFLVFWQCTDKELKIKCDDHALQSQGLEFQH